LIDHYEPVILTAQDYYPFGMISRAALPNNGQTYRFGFNGQEMNNEVKGLGNSYTAMFWEYDSRIGRRWNLDPKPTPGISEYSVFNNNPILLNDVLGDTSKLGTRIIGGLKAAGGLLMGAGSAALGASTSWTGVGAVAGGAGVLYSADVTSSGLKQMWTGEEESTFTNKAVTTGLQQVGVSPAKAQTIANYTEFGLGLALGGKPTTRLLAPLTREEQLAREAAVLAKADAATAEAAAKAMASKVSTFAKENSIYSSIAKNKMYPEIVKKYLNQMKAGTFDATAKENMIGGFLDKTGNYILGEGHHRMNAAIQYAIETGNNTFVQQLIKNGRWTSIQNLKQYGLKMFPLPTK
jgi:RHS repeat-associated protein